MIPAALSFFRRAKEIVPGLDVFGLHAGLLLEQFLVVIEERPRRPRTGPPTTLPSTLKASFAVWAKRSLPRRDIGGNILEKARLVLRLHDASGPAIEQIRARIRLQHGRQLGLVGLILEILELDLHAGMRRIVIVGDLLPKPPFEPRSR